MILFNFFLKKTEMQLQHVNFLVKIDVVMPVKNIKKSPNSVSKLTVKQNLGKNDEQFSILKMIVFLKMMMSNFKPKTVSFE